MAPRPQFQEIPLGISGATPHQFMELLHEARKRGYVPEVHRRASKKAG
jgi:hypothetical protein